jgi:hypothetical protein
MAKVFQGLCESTDSPVSLGLWLRFKYSQKELATFRLNPRNYNDAATFRADYMLASFLRKWKGLETGIDTEEVAIQKFSASEETCNATNKRLLCKTEDPYRSRAEAILHSASRKISAMLGPFELRKVLNRCEWTAGATLEIPKRQSFVDTKLTQLPITVTRQALPYIRLEIESDGRWFEAMTGIFPEGSYSLLPCCFEVVRGNRITTVPKDSSTDRVIAVEPRANIFLQKGVGNYMRSRLKRFRVDLSKQEINQSWAHLALELDLCTIDLSSASDTIALELVYQLLPVDWAIYLDSIRSPYGSTQERTFKYEKFSSMGNGFTFELESMIFFAICEAVQDTCASRDDWRLTSVYGDDIIVPKWCYAEVVECLRYCGFEVNASKSYADGLFYESCGKHYFDSEDVTPIYQKELLDEIEAMRCGNRLMRWSTRYSSSIPQNSWHILRRTFRLLSECQIPEDAEGDDGWVVPKTYRFRKDFNRGRLCRVVRFIKKALPAHDEALLAYSLRKLSWRSNSVYAPKPGIHFESYKSLNLEERIGFLWADLGEGDGRVEFEVESARFTFGWRWIHTNDVIAPA